MASSGLGALSVLTVDILEPEQIMRTPARILIVDDNPENLDILQTRLARHGYEILTARDGEEALATARETLPDLILLDIMMPKLDGIEVCRRLKADRSLPFMPIIMVTAKADSKDIVAGLEAGGDEYLTKPVDQAALVARVKSMLRIKGLHDTGQEQAARLESQAAELSEWNRTLEHRVQQQVTQLERLGRLKRFFSPQLAELIVAGNAEDPLKSHRREVTVVFLDLRGFTAFAESAEPEEVMAVLREYHAEMGRQILAHEGTLERFTGDGLMIFFNDPVPVPNAGERAVRMALAMRDRVGELTVRWRKLGYDLDCGMSLAQGYATIGAIGFEGRWDYGAIGTVTNLAARLCGEAKPGQILIPRRFLGTVEDLVEAEPVGELSLKGFHRPITAYNILRLKG
jgi:DNA-binding response OmpR family regulator